jgi:transcriptional regulator with GAF, ATPase, and Fis domain
MMWDENQFFREATLQISSSLDIDKALSSFLKYISTFTPAAKASLCLMEPSARTFRGLVVVDSEGGTASIPLTELPREAILELDVSRNAGVVRINHWDENSALVRSLPADIDLKNRSLLTMDLGVEGKHLGIFSAWARNGEVFTQDHLRLISLVREPVSIAMSNALRHEEIVKLMKLLDAENRELRQELIGFSCSHIVGATHGLKNTIKMVKQVAPLNTPVIILGETGVGKEVVANAIHYTSARKDGPFVKVNCGAIPDSLVDSELFGHERGAFTGANAQKKGRFERAEGGTIFLDEIGELPLPAQVRLLRVLQNKEIERVGGTKTIPVSVRIIAATHRDIEEQIREGVFRNDLWFRLNVFPIVIPPLRQRKEDIAALVHHFIEKKSKELKLYPPPSVPVEEIEHLKGYHWPGNIRELENLVERELIQARGKGKPELLRFNQFRACEKAGLSRMERGTERDVVTLDEAMSRQIREALRTTNGIISGPKGAARLLGINPNTLRGRMRKLGIFF